MPQLFSSITPTREGLALGETLITKRLTDGTFAIAGREEEILALLSIGYRRLIGPEILGKLRAASKAYSQTAPGDWPSLRDPGYRPSPAPDIDANAPSARSRTLMHLALTGLNKAGDVRELDPHLPEFRKMLDAGVAPRVLLKAAGLTAPASAAHPSCKDYNPNEPRDNHGRWTVEGLSAALARLNTAGPKSGHHCAASVRQAITAGGIQIKAPPPRSDNNVYASDYGPSLEASGFIAVASANTGAGYPPPGYTPQAGDVVVMQNHPGGSIEGHMAMYNGEQWVSDFWQKPHPDDTQAFWPGPGYRSFKPSYVIYRY